MIYYAIVFGAGFALALIRVPLLVPHFGVRTAELMEMPIMLAVIFFAARWIVRTKLVGATHAARIGVGMIALSLLLLTEFTVVLWLQGLSLREAVLNRDPVSGTAYALSLALFALMPWLIARRTQT